LKNFKFIKFKIKFVICVILIFFLFSWTLEIHESQLKNLNYQFNLSAPADNYTITSGYPFTWINASSGTELVLGDDDSVSTLLPFNFTFYDNFFREIYITTEGYLTFTFKSVQTSGTIPSGHPHQQNLIAPYWTNLDGASGSIYIKNFSSYWVVAWENFNHDNGSYAGTFETILYNNGDIVFNYNILRNVSTYACGLNYGDGNNYSSYNQLSSGVNDFSIKFSRTLGNNGNGGIDSNIINAIVGVVVPVVIISAVGGTVLYFYKKNPEQFKKKLSQGKAKLKGSASQLKKKIKDGLSKSKEQDSKGKNVIKQKTPKKEQK